MLILSRKRGEEIMIGDDIRVVVNRIAGNRVTVAIQAPKDMRIVRGELDSHLPQNEGATPEGGVTRLVSAV
jgi:carbon storage regulator CsrA